MDDRRMDREDPILNRGIRMLELTGEKIITAKIRVDENKLLGKSLPTAEIKDCTVTLHYTDGHVFTAPASELNIEVVTLENVKED